MAQCLPSKKGVHDCSLIQWMLYIASLRTGFTPSHTVNNITIFPGCTITMRRIHVNNEVCSQKAHSDFVEIGYCYANRLLWGIAAGTVHNQKENRVPLPYNVCTLPSLQWRVCIYSKEKSSPISIVGLASSRDSRSSLAILKNKGKRIRTTTNQENKKSP